MVSTILVSVMAQDFCLLVSASPLKTQAHLTAIRFVEALNTLNARVKCVFFYQDAVLVANAHSVPPSDEPQISDRWIKLAEEGSFELQTCVSASLRRGILDQRLAEEYEQPAASANDRFVMAGLGQLAAAMSDKQVKLIHFK